MKRLFQLFKRQSDAPQVAARPAAALPFTRLTLDDWRSSEERTAYVAALLRDPMFLELVGMLANVRPVSRGPLDATTAAMLLGQRAGHDQIIATLLEAGRQSAAAPPTLEADYAAENVMATWNAEADAF